MYQLFAITLLAGIIQIVFGVLVGLPAYVMAKRRRWWASAIAAPAAFVVTMYVGGVIFTVPSAIAVTALYYAMSVLRGGRRRWARTLHAVVGTLIIVWAFAQVVHLPVRFYLEQEPARIAGNVAGIGVALALTAAFIESLVRGTSGLEKDVWKKMSGTFQVERPLGSQVAKFFDRNCATRCVRKELEVSRPQTLVVRHKRLAPAS
jgi:hypothetical protein